MSGQNIAIAAVVLVAFGGGAWWVISDPVGDQARSAQDDAADVMPADRDEVESEDMPSGMGSMRDLMMRGESMECSFTFTDADGASGEGTSFFDGERVRMDTMVQFDGQTYNASNIIRSNEMYAWGTMPQGEFAIVMPLEDGMEDEEFMDEEAPVGVDEEVDYDCQPWSVDNSVFTPPQDVEFMDMSEMMQGMMQGMPDMEDMEGMDPDEMEAMMEEMMQGMPQ